MSTEKRSDLEHMQELFGFLQGVVPEGYRIPRAHVPKLTPDQAWTVCWYLGNQYHQLSDYISRCDVCGDLYDSNSEGDCLDFGKAPYHFCDSCVGGEQYASKSARVLCSECDGLGSSPKRMVRRNGKLLCAGCNLRKP